MNLPAWTPLTKKIFEKGRSYEKICCNHEKFFLYDLKKLSKERKK